MPTMNVTSAFGQSNRWNNRKKAITDSPAGFLEGNFSELANRGPLLQKAKVLIL